MDPKKVDVNVHPTKLEVRFQEDGKVFKAVYNAIKQALLKFDLVPDPDKDYKNETPNDILKSINANVNSNLFTTKVNSNSWNINEDNLKDNTTEKSDNIEKIEEKKENKIPEFQEFKSQVTTLDAETRKKFIDEITGTKSPEEIGIKLADITKSYIENKNDKEKKEETLEKIEQKEENNTDLEVSDEKIENKVQKEEEPGNKEENNDEYKVDKKEEEKEETFEEMYKRLFGRDINDAKKEYEEERKKQEDKYPISPITGKEISMFEQEGIDNNPQYKFIGIAFKTYIILTIGEDLYILDQHAAHERIMYEKVKANYYSEGEKDSQLMLLPDIINLSTREMGIFRDNKEMFNRAGFVVDEFGDNTVKLTGVPEFCLDFDTKEIFLETLDEINTVARTAKQELENKFLATVACKAAVKAHMALTKEEVDSLMNQLLKLPNPFTCPHGRPTVIKMSKNDIEKKFSRR